MRVNLYPVSYALSCFVKHVTGCIRGLFRINRLDRQYLPRLWLCFKSASTLTILHSQVASMNVFVLTDSSRNDPPICTKLGMFICRDEKGKIGGQKLRKKLPGDEIPVAQKLTTMEEQGQDQCCFFLDLIHRLLY